MSAEKFGETRTTDQRSDADACIQQSLSQINSTWETKIKNPIRSQNL